MTHIRVHFTDGSYNDFSERVHFIYTAKDDNYIFAYAYAYDRKTMNDIAMIDKKVFAYYEEIEDEMQL